MEVIIPNQKTHFSRISKLSANVNTFKLNEDYYNLSLRKSWYDDKIKYNQSNIESYLNTNFNIADLKSSTINKLNYNKCSNEDLKSNIHVDKIIRVGNFHSEDRKVNNYIYNKRKHRKIVYNRVKNSGATNRNEYVVFSNRSQILLICNRYKRSKD